MYCEQVTQGETGCTVGKLLREKQDVLWASYSGRNRMYCGQVTQGETGCTVNPNIYCEQSRCNVKVLLRENQNVLYGQQRDKTCLRNF